MNQILSNLKQSLNVKNKKLLFLLLFIIQSGFLALVVYFFIHYYTIIIELLNSMIQSLDQITPDTLQNTYQSMSMYTNIRNVTDTFFKAAVIIYVLYSFVNSLNWDFTNYFVSKKLGFPFYEIHFAVLAFIFLFPVMVLTKIILDSLLKIGFPDIMQLLFYVILFAAWYFMMISFALISKYELSQLKQQLKQTFIIGYKKAKILIPTYLIIIAVLGLFIYLISALQDVPYLFVNLLSIILFIIALVWSRIYFLTTMKNILK